MKKRLLLFTGLLLATTVLVACFGLYLKCAYLNPLQLCADKSAIEVPFLAINDPVIRYALRAEMSMAPVTHPGPTGEKGTESQDTTVPTEVPAVTATVPPYAELTESWFDDALFIGDSRTVGLRDYARLGNADYFCSVGMSVFGVLDATESDENFEKTNLLGLLRQKKYHKIYISLGLNDCEAPYELVMDAYYNLIKTVRKEQPDAVVILQSMITLGRNKASSKWYFSIENLNQVNAGIRDFADGHHVYYIDANTYFADEEGYLPDEKSFDGCHFDIAGYQEWAQWILDNAKTLNVSFG